MRSCAKNTDLFKLVLLLQLHFGGWQSLFTNVVNNFVCIKNPIRAAVELPAKKWPPDTKNKQRERNSAVYESL